MKNVLILLICSFLINCGEVKKIEKKVPEITIPDSLKGKTLEGENILVGKISLAQLKHFSSWYNKEYDFYKVDPALTEEIKPLLKDVSITLIMGTWCEDSEREVGGMIKILETAGYPIDSINLIAVSEDKDTPNGIEKPFNLAYVPTLIFNKNDEELNRIVEFPIVSLEQDIFTILKGAPYKNAYAE